MLTCCNAQAPTVLVHVQVRCDEKGFLAVCAFGLPGKTHEDMPARGIQAALSIVEALRLAGGVRPAIIMQLPAWH